MAAEILPDQVAAVEEKVRRRFPDATIGIDAPSDPQGPWFLDISLQGQVVAVQWRPDRGFGVTTDPSTGGYGEGVHETFKDPDSAYTRITALLLGQASTVPPEPVRWRELRALREVSRVNMVQSRFNLLTIRSSDIDRAVRFYEALGLQFTRHAHGTGPEHYCSEDAGVVFEIYPLEPGKTPTTDVRLGFAVPSVEAATAELSALGARVVAAPAESAWGRRAVVADFDGHRVELTAAIGG